MAERALEAIAGGEQEEEDQLGLFETKPYTKRSISFGGAGDIDAPENYELGTRLKGTWEGEIVKVTFHDKKGTVSRQHVVNIDDVKVKRG